MSLDLNLSNLMFVDIETVSAEASFDDLGEVLKREWSRKASNLKNKEELSVEDLFFERAGIYAEFGKVVVISVGIFHTLDNDETELRIKCISGENEKEILENFKETVMKFDQGKLRLCAHNGKEFDFPYLCRRMLINGINLPPSMDVAGKKSWEIHHLDTMEMWKFGDYKSYISLDLLAALFDVQAVKEENMKGSDVNRLYYKDKSLEQIARFCKRNVSVLAQVFLHLQSLDPIRQENITVV
ncbi:DNA polymerase elongation subunit (family B) [Catalinimonas alkaloidigena]|uniref:ribonuclease H-like domain-containing protein n=1 Tax=Catalinimonas alkaloidigena TaxID=1075417 RepID=UPI0024053E26|nr:ribonuclease H-like domain-containing protein [Catalinimonas alkaloidigena]MDF9798273.1 DNA polymerase elongation subunit (family B) [Catalinimonas alkaloidigena]